MEIRYWTTDQGKELTDKEILESLKEWKPDKEFYIGRNREIVEDYPGRSPRDVQRGLGASAVYSQEEVERMMTSELG